MQLSPIGHPCVQLLRRCHPMVGEIDVLPTNKRARSAALPQSAESDSASYQRSGADEIGPAEGLPDPGCSWCNPQLTRFAWDKPFPGECAPQKLKLTWINVPRQARSHKFGCSSRNLWRDTNG